MELRSTLIRSITTVIKRTPPHLLKEIILIDDFSRESPFRPRIARLPTARRLAAAGVSRPTLSPYPLLSNRPPLCFRFHSPGVSPLDCLLTTPRNNPSTPPPLAAEPVGEDIAAMDKIVLHRMSERVGLIRGRTKGADMARGDVILFLDSHIEVNQQWVEPLLQQISDHPTHVVTPVIDLINDDNLKYHASPLVRGGFSWDMQFRWKSLPGNTVPNHRQLSRG